MKVYNKGVNPIVYNRTLSAVDVLHPHKFVEFEKKIAEGFISVHENACSEEEYKKLMKEKRKTDVKDKKK